jgi:nicotinamidase-related amidase
MPINAKPTPGKGLLSPSNHALILIDFQSQMSFATKSIDAVNLRTNAALISEAAAGFKVPSILTTVAEKSFSGPMFGEIVSAFAGQKLIDRTSMNTWEDENVIKEVNRIGKERLVFAGLWTRSALLGRRCPRSIRASRSMLSRMPVATFPRKPTSAPWSE